MVKLTEDQITQTRKAIITIENDFDVIIVSKKLKQIIEEMAQTEHCPQGEIIYSLITIVNNAIKKPLPTPDPDASIPIEPENSYPHAS